MSLETQKFLMIYLPFWLIVIPLLLGILYLCGKEIYDISNEDNKDMKNRKLSEYTDYNWKAFKQNTCKKCSKFDPLVIIIHYLDDDFTLYCCNCGTRLYDSIEQSFENLTISNSQKTKDLKDAKSLERVTKINMNNLCPDIVVRIPNSPHWF